MFRFGLLSFLLIALVSCATDVDSTPPSFNLGATPSLTISQGNANQSRVTASFDAEFAGVVTLNLEAPEGITGTFDPPSITATTPESMLSVNVDASVAPGNYELRIKGTSAVATKTTTLTLTVETKSGVGNPLSLAASGGTINLGNAHWPGTLLVYKILLGNSLPTGLVDLKLTGPTGWNDDKPFFSQVIPEQPVNMLILPNTEAVKGPYTLEAKLGDELANVSFVIDNTLKLSQAQSVEAKGTTTRVLASWGVVDGAFSYLASLKSETGDAQYMGDLTTERTTTFKGDFKPGIHTIQLYAFSADLKDSSASLDAQINASLSAPFPFTVLLVPPLSITIFAATAFDGNGQECLVFFAAPSEEAKLFSVTIAHEAGFSIGTVQLSGAVTAPFERLPLQPSGVCYAKVKGRYTFVLKATLSNDPTELTVNSTYVQPE